MPTLYSLLGIGIAGMVGTLARYGTGWAASAAFGSGYPYGTYIVNVLGCLLFGLAAGLIETSSPWRVIILTGFLGGFTTFSAFAFENHELLTQQRWLSFAVHCLGQNILGIAAVFAGLALVSK
ncbi:putative fluoride ion transporter CrcB [Planctomycetales bacterium]|nr:putative fluoride ion transporter CrcB [Planctomycetales bacterium]